ncbi:MAG: ClpXP protease specificity-enhancing factor SspB [Alphaproteobacteria bacterium]|nr:ClpXP protease specificity-enhancing factor SspB [Alphaproteobacteria bacterium]
MADTPLNYEIMVEDAMRGVAREALREVASRGLPGSHQIYIGFKTDAPGVEIPDHLRAQYPEEITIVLEHQFWDLSVDETGFSIGLAFGGKREHLQVPFAALTSFVDPSVDFGLQFAKAGKGETRAGGGAQPKIGKGEGAQPKIGKGEAVAGGDGAGEKVVSLDKFRK